MEREERDNLRENNTSITHNHSSEIFSLLSKEEFHLIQTQLQQNMEEMKKSHHIPTKNWKTMIKRIKKIFSKIIKTIIGSKRPVNLNEFTLPNNVELFPTYPQIINALNVIDQLEDNNLDRLQLYYPLIIKSLEHSINFPYAPYTRNVKLINDVLYEYLESGDQKSPNKIIHLHGLVGSCENFLGQMQDEGLNKSAHQIAINLYHTFYDGNTKEVNFEEINNYLSRFLDHHKWGSVHLHGVSLGGEIAYKYAIFHPKKINSLILSGASGLQKEKFDALTHISKIKSLLNLPNPKTLITRAVGKQFYDKKMIPSILPEEILSAIKNKEKKNRIEKFAEIAQSPNISYNKQSLHIVKKHNIPTLLLWGEHDSITPAKEITDNFSEILGKNSFTHQPFFPSGHTPNIECPDEYNDVFVQRLKQYIQKNML